LKRTALFGITLAICLMASGTAFSAALNVEGEASPINAAPENSENAGLVVSVTDQNGAAVRGLGDANFKVDATIVAPGGAFVDIKRADESFYAPGFYILEIAPTTYMGTQYTWKSGVYLFSVTVQNGANRGQAVVELDLRNICIQTTAGSSGIAGAVGVAVEPVGAAETQPSTGAIGTVDIILPDLRVTQVTAGTPEIEDNGREADVPLTVTIKNFGGSTSSEFKISTDVKVGDDGTFVKPFTVPGQGDIWYPRQNGLGAGEEATFSGSLYVGNPSGSSLYGQKAIITAKVDSCSGDEFMPEYCRVKESNEANNERQTSIEFSKLVATQLVLTPFKMAPIAIS
jgi:hypothetical protein